MSITTDAPRQKRRTVAADLPPDGHRRKRRFNTIWLFLVPAVIPYVFVVIVPSLQGVAYSFTDWNGLNPDFGWVGFDNYVRLFSDQAAVRAVTNTLTLAIIVTVFENVIGLALALALHTRIKSRNALRVVFFAPVVVLSVVVAFLWQFIYTPNGPINQVLQTVGLGEWTQNWLGDPDIALYAISVIMIWQFSGYAMVIYLAGLQGVPQEQLEAAQIDGAGAFQRFWYIVRPLLAPAITVNVMLALIRGLMSFDQIWVTTQGGPAQSTETLSTLVYRNAFQYGEFSYSAAIAVVLAAFVAALAIIQYRLLSRSGKNS
jgi:raffinose/stachyose/melibiose transport system permease protein